MTGYSNPWRPIYELPALLLWTGVAGFSWVTADLWDLHAASFRWLAAGSLVMAATWLPGVVRGINRRDWLRGRPQEFIAPQEFAQRMAQGKPGYLWVGRGFDWEARHAQEALDLQRAGPEGFAPRDHDRLGATWIHGLGGADQDIMVPLSHTEGHLLVVGTTGCGKAQSVNARIHTPSGWVRMGDVRVGDRVSTPDGRGARIIGVFPQGRIPVHRVTFVDGRSAVASGDHLWEVHHKHWNGKYKPGQSRIGGARPCILTTEQIRDLLARNKGCFAVRLCNPVDKPAAELPIHPYVLGCMIGDATFGKGNRLIFTNPCPSIVERINSRLPDGVRCVHCGPRAIDYTFRGGTGGRCRNGGDTANPLRRAIIRLGLSECRSWEKYIPAVYKEASVLQRWDLLRGLMDTDGTVGRRLLSGISYSTSSRQLAKDVQELMWSLGGIAKISTRVPTYRYRGEIRQGRLAYRVNIRHPEPRRLFADGSKRDRVPEVYQYEDCLKLRIVSVEPAGEDECQCIAIDHPERLYVTDGYVPTHNTRLFDLLVTQAVLRGDAVLILDPKGDQGLRASAERACALAGAPERFVYFHPAFPSESVRLDPLRNFQRATELASRVAALIPSETGNDPFKAFGQMALSHAVHGLLAVEERPTLVTLRRYLEGGAESLIERVLERYFDQHMPNWREHVTPYTGKGNAPNRRAKGLLSFYRERVRAVHPSTVVDGLAGLLDHEAVHFSKMIASLMPVLVMLTSGNLEGLLSPNDADPDDPRRAASLGEIIARREVLYVGLDSLSDPIVGSAIGSMLTADLAAVAGAIYNNEPNPRPVSIFIDEGAETVSDPMIQLLNKGRGAGLRLTIATQTFADFAARMGSEDKARQVLGNLNGLIAMRVIDAKTQEYIAEGLPPVRLRTVVRSEGATTPSDEPMHFSGNAGERLDEEEAPLFPAALLGELPNFEYLARWPGGRVAKGRLPILGSPLQPRSSTSTQ